MNNSSIPWWMRIKVHFLLFGVTMSILPLFFLGYLGFTSVRQNLEKDIYAQNFEQVTVLAHELKDTFANLENSLTLTKPTSAYALVGKDKTLRQVILETLLQKDPLIEKIQVSDINYKVIDQISYQEGVSAPSPAAKLENIISPGTFPAISKVLYTHDKRPKIYLTVTIQDPATKRNIGYLQAQIDVNRIINRYDSLQLGEGEYIFFVDQTGNLMGTSDSFLRLHPDKIRDNAAVQSFLDGKAYSQGSEYKSLSGISVVGSYTSVGSPNWAVVIEQPTREANKPINEFALRLIIIAILIMVLVMILSIAFGLQVVHPIENLEAQVQQIISTGNLESHIPIESWDEIGRLVKSFNQLLNSLDEKNENLKNEKELLTTVVDGVGAGMVLLNTERRIIWWNSKFAEWFGDNLADSPCDQVVNVKESENVQLENGRTISVFVHEERRYFRQMYYNLSPDNPENAAYLLLLDDVTQEVEMEARMIETDKMAAVGLLASGVAHEINNPLAIVAAHCEDLLDRMNEEEPQPTTEEFKGGFKIVLEQIVRCKKITDRLLGFARKRSNEGTDLIDIAAASMQAVELIAHKAKQKQLEIKLQLESSLYSLGNENEWQQVVLNLLTNALDASPESGIIEVKGYRDGETINFIVQDYGEGISQANLKKAFDPFFTTKSIGQGTGLGLYVSYGIVLKMQGAMALESTEGQGTCVKITLPFHKAGD
ncbi:signal transduction histidine kinase [Desulfosporosinus acidiphilus SJ4]|uniref:histidine kinase n=1 Tax=Desulfosporosinus acidiphilus (strain DSM 22704 / JCM 16185 / SJ4) TaxID=646529 RepID=I4D0Y7_DESAJ|nr:ATP-binding protein [Desulfosporosinus acidiphilus]AFM39461.1 signal transduction histidine kinase [Desulfosporosinus acidiphilus SJ4]